MIFLMILSYEKATIIEISFGILTTISIFDILLPNLLLPH